MNRPSYQNFLVELINQFFLFQITRKEHQIAIKIEKFLKISDSLQKEKFFRWRKRSDDVLENFSVQPVIVFENTTDGLQRLGVSGVTVVTAEKHRIPRSSIAHNSNYMRSSTLNDDKQ